MTDLVKRLRRNPLICMDGVDATGAAADRIEELEASRQANVEMRDDIIRKLQSRIEGLEADRRNLLDTDLKAKVCIDQQREIIELRSRIELAKRLMAEHFPGFVVDALNGRPLEKMPDVVQNCMELKERRDE